MIRSLHIGKFIEGQNDLYAILDFLEAIGLQVGNRTLGEHPYISFSGPEVSLGFGLGTKSGFLDIGLFDTETAYQLAKTKGIKILRDFAEDRAARVFTLEFPGGTHVVLHPVSELSGMTGQISAQGKRFGVVVARFNSFITERLLVGARDALLISGAERQEIEIVRVPGAFEIPSAARTLAETRKFDAIICIGCLLRGDTAHYDVIVNEVTRGIGQSAQETGVPHAFGVLTCDTLEQAIDRAGLKMGNKGFEAALAAVEMANLKTVISKTAVGGQTSKSVVRRTSSAVGKRKPVARRASKSARKKRH